MNVKYPALIALLCATSAQASNVFINEIHYDNAGSDLNEFVEIAAPENTVLTGWSIAFYNGSASQLSVYNTLPIEGELVNIENGYGYISVYPSSIQNGAPDGVALVDSNNNLVQFLSYEGSMTAASGVAQGLTSEDIGVQETSSTPVGFSLQLSGSNGASYSDFTWQEPAIATPSAANNSQSFGDGDILDIAPSITTFIPASGSENVALDQALSITFSEAVNVSQWNAIQCNLSGAISVSASNTGNTFTLTPSKNFMLGDTCSFTVKYLDVSDIDGEPNNLSEDATFSFSVLSEVVEIDLIINEFQADPASDISGDANGDGTRDSSQDEFVELVNPTEIAVDISGWTLSDSYGLRHTFPEHSVIPAGCAAVVFGGGEPTGDFGGALVQKASSGGVGLNNGGDSIILSNGAASLEIAYGSNAGSNQSLNLSPDISGETYEKHSEISGTGGELFSPGTQSNGAKYNGCSIPDIAPTVLEVSPNNNDTNVAVDTTINLVFSEDVTVSSWQSLACSTSGEVALTGNTTGSSFVLTPAQTLANNELCTFNVSADSVADTDNTINYMASDLTSSFTTEPLLSCNSESLELISTIQGTGTASNYVNQSVQVQGVVTSVLPSLEAFIMQEEAADEDGNPSSSEGIFIYNESNAFAMPQVGDVVLAEGIVAEFYNRTQIALTRSPIACGQGEVAATELNLPFTSLEQAESLEGMLVTSSQPLIVSDNYNLGQYGEVTLSSKRLYTPTNIYLPGSEQASALSVANQLDQITLDDGQNGSDPETVVFPTGNLSASNTLRTGDTVALLTGVVDYSFSKYRVIPTQEVVFSSTNQRTAAPELNLGNLKVASLNVLNYFTTLDVGTNICSPNNNLGCRGANTVSEFERQKTKTVSAIVAMDADIVGLMEIENNGFNEASAISDLVSAINAQMGEGTYAIVDAGSTIGTDAITVALIYKPSVVTPSGAVAILDSSNSITDNDGPLFNDGKNRPAVAQKFALVENAEEVAISVNHFKSKGSGCGAGDDDKETGQGNCNLTRTRAAQALTTFLSTQFPDTPTLIIGDLNSYAKEDPIRQIEQAGFTNLVHHFGGDKAYSYSFGGQAGYLDHALANGKALAKVVDVTEWHINADEPIVLDYNTEDKSNAQLAEYYAADAYRMSDHDPVIIAMDLKPSEPTLTTSLDVNQDGAINFTDYFAILAILGSQEGDGNFNTLADYDADKSITPLDLQAWYQQYLSQ